MDLITAIRTCLRKYVDYSGRASRSEFWLWVVAYLGAVLIAGVFDAS